MICRRQALRWLFGSSVSVPAGAAMVPPQEVSVAAASNLTTVSKQLAAAFVRETGIRPVFSFGSTSQLARQIRDGAPFDVFAAADTEHVDALVRAGLIVRQSRTVYATGVLAVWFPGTTADLRRFEDLGGASVRTIAIARPELAPYGAAAVEALRAAGLWTRVQPRVVYAGSVAMAKQYGVTGNADAVFLPLALVLQEKTGVVLVDKTIYRPLYQALGIVAASRRLDGANRFASFLMKGTGHQILLANGYR